MQFLLLLVAATSTSTAAAPPAYNLFNLLSPEDVRAELEFRHEEAQSFPDLLELVTQGLVGAPYVLSPLGEGEGGQVDSDPRLRWDYFDCTTFVETAMALAATDDPAQVQSILDDIRYEDGQVGFQNRRHLVMSQWLPGLRADGWLEDVTEVVGGDETITSQVKLPEAWEKRRIARTLKLTRLPEGQFSLQYLSLATLEKVQDKVPDGTLVNILRRPQARAPDYVTHQGLVLVVNGVKVVRHASPVSKRIIDEPLARMIQRYLHPSVERKWPIVGMSFHRLLPNRK